MKNQELKEILLTKQQLKYNTMIQEYILQMRKSQYAVIQNQAPNVCGRQYNFLLSLIITTVIVFFNYDQLFIPQQPPTQLVPFKNLHELQKKVQFVFQHTLIKYTILYPINITQCDSIIPFIKSDTLCREKSIELKIKFTFDIGYRPDYDNLQYNPKNNSVSGDYGALQILNCVHDRQIESQTTGFLSDWSVLQFEKKYNQIKQAVRPKLQKRVQDYILNYTQNQNSLDTFQKNIKKSLMSIMKDRTQSKEPLSTRILNVINHSFDKLLILLSMDPLFFTQQTIQKDQFSQQDVTEFYKEQVLKKQERDKIETQIAQKINKKQQTNTQTKTSSKQIKQQNKKSNQPQNYNSQEVRLKYNQLLQKIK